MSFRGITVVAAKYLSVSATISSLYSITCVKVFGQLLQEALFFRPWLRLHISEPSKLAPELLFGHARWYSCTSGMQSSLQVKLYYTGHFCKFMFGCFSAQRQPGADDLAADSRPPGFQTGTINLLPVRKFMSGQPVSDFRSFAHWLPEDC